MAKEWRSENSGTVAAIWVPCPEGFHATRRCEVQIPQLRYASPRFALITC